VARAVLAALVGARVRRVDRPARGLLALTLDPAPGGDARVLVIGLDRAARGVGLVDERPPGPPATGFVTQLRAAIEGARIVGAAVEGRTLGIDLRRGDEVATLSVRLDGARGAIAVRDADDCVRLGERTPREVGPRAAGLPSDGADGGPDAGADGVPGGGGADAGGAARAPSTPALEVPEDDGALRAAGAALVERAVAAELGDARRAVRRAITAALRKLDRRAEAIAADLAAADEAIRLRADAACLLAHAHALGAERRRDARAPLPERAPDAHAPRVVTLPDPETGAPRTIAIPAGRGPIAHAEALFARARRLASGRRAAEERAQVTAEERAAAEALRLEAERAPDLAALAAVARRARAQRIDAPLPGEHGPGGALAPGRDRASPGRAPAPGRPAPRTRGPTRLPYRRFVASGGRAVLVGRGAADNDALTLRHARPHDLWLHARGRPGAHVVVPLDRGASCPAEVLVDAATLAAHFSDARGEPVVEVQYVARRFVRKPRGAAPGAVAVEREKVLAVRLEPARLARLLASETLPT
jgi:predicted ribosome quality control (RQC) complex YloA/Tae2 family protein